MSFTLPFPIPFQDPVLIFALVMVLILVSPFLSQRLKLPSTVGLILAGMVVGPSLTGLLARDGTIILLGTVGLLYLIFTAGLSIDLNQFSRLRNRSLVFGMFSIGLPFGLAYIVGLHVLNFEMNPVLLLGAIVGSHTLLAYPLVTKLGLSRHPSVTVTMGGTIVTDFISLMVLGFVIAAERDPTINAQFWLVFLSSIAFFLGFISLVIPRLARWFFRTFTEETEADYVFLLAILFVTAYLAKLAGLAPIIGAFMSGLLLNKLVPDSSPLMNRVQFMGNALFIPFFLISVGMLVDVNVMRSSEVWYYALMFTSMVVVGKGLAAWLSGKIYSFSTRHILLMLGLSIPQAAATLAVTLIGFEIGLFNAMIVNAVVIMILITCLMGPWMVDRYGRQIAIEEDQLIQGSNDRPQRILVPLANPTTAEALMDIAFAMRDKSSMEPVYPLTVVRDGPNVQADVASSERMLSHAVIYSASANIPVSPVTRVDMNISSGITRAVKERRITNVIIGWNGQISATEAIFGGVLDQLLSQVRHMIMVCKMERRISTVRRIYYAIPPFATLEPGFMESLRYVMILASQIGAELTIIGIEERMVRIQTCVKSAKQPLKATFIALERWSELPEALQSHLGSDDLFILQSAREGTLSWRPGLDRLPSLVSSRFPDIGFIAIYPSETGEQVEGDQEPEEKKPLDRLIDDASVIFPSKDAHFDQILMDLMADLYPKSPETAQQRSAELIRSNNDYNSELTSGVVLLEAIADDIDEPRLMMAICRNRIAVPKAPSPICAMAVVIHPAGERTAEHLERLNQLARRLRNPELPERLARATSVEQVIRLLNTTD
jgi:Kef-type K+ transport system membrane component KefB/mannitol/fructose-specific phosphotransferase system IIA component (Ntr-type)